ncbi:universal stress protein [Streptomyces sp. SBST2-5]|uniref:Universal stress protein n=1 Tax=Streptomyces composti TaxID=2720025 RepID=A0ABX0ZX76_9ACTN|nr:universal stress protein [Streptomyces composti]NJP48695.1 universal stress protein [Streptomyces composti]
MFRSIAVGLDGSLQSRAAAEWAAREAELWQLPLRLVHVWEPVPEPVAEVAHLTPEKLRRWSEQIPRQVADGLRSRHRELDVRVESVPGSPMDVLPRVAKETELLVLGSRGLSGLGGFLVGSVGMYVIGHTEAPVVLVRAVAGADGEERERASSAGAARLPVVLGIDTRHPDDAVIAFAFEEAARRGTAVRAVHAWTLPAHYAFALPAGPRLGDDLGEQEAAALTKILSPWRETFPDVEVVEESAAGSAASRLVEASREASLVVVGRRIRRAPVGVHIGPVTHAVLHHCAAPVAVVAHH